MAGRDGWADLIAVLGVQAGLSPAQAWQCTWGDLETWARAGHRLMKAETRLTCLAVSAAFNGGAAWREFVKATRDD